MNTQKNTRTKITDHKNKVFEDFQVNIKLKISALWITIMFCYLYGDYIQLNVPEVLAQAMELKATAANINIQLQFLAIAVLMVIPSVMVFFTLVLKPEINRKLNITICALYIVLLIMTNLTETWAYYLFLTAVEILISATIIGYAWNWPKIKEQAL